LGFLPRDLVSEIEERDRVLASHPILVPMASAALQKAANLTTVIEEEAKSFAAKKEEEIRQKQASAHQVAGGPPGYLGSATAFFVTPESHAVTNLHAVKPCGSIRIGEETATVAAIDKSADVAILKLNRAPGAFATFREGRGVRVGDGVVTVGFPLQSVLNSIEPNVTTGTVSALSGADDDRRFLRLTAPVQPGNRGGPLLDLSGNVVGVVFARLVGGETQNVNFAVSEATLRGFLDAEDIPYKTALSATELKHADVAEHARAFTVSLECWH
jgi:S1-C subfamily serine protease